MSVTTRCRRASEHLLDRQGDALDLVPGDAEAWARRSSCAANSNVASALGNLSRRAYSGVARAVKMSWLIERYRRTPCSEYGVCAVRHHFRTMAQPEVKL